MEFKKLDRSFNSQEKAERFSDFLRKIGVKSEVVHKPDVYHVIWKQDVSKHKKLTPESKAMSFEEVAQKSIQHANSFTADSNDYMLQYFYNHFRFATVNMASHAIEDFGIELPWRPPPVQEDDYYEGLMNLADYCMECAAMLKAQPRHEHGR